MLQARMDIEPHDVFERFAQTVAPLYVINGWLGQTDIVEAERRVLRLVQELYDGVRRSVAEGRGGVKHSSGRAYVQYSPDPDGMGMPELAVGLDLCTIIPNDDGIWTDVQDFEV